MAFLAHLILYILLYVSDLHPTTSMRSRPLHPHPFAHPLDPPPHTNSLLRGLIVVPRHIGLAVLAWLKLRKNARDAHFAERAASGRHFDLDDLSGGGGGSGGPRLHFRAAGSGAGDDTDAGTDYGSGTRTSTDTGAGTVADPGTDTGTDTASDADMGTNANARTSFGTSTVNGSDIGTGTDFPSDTQPTDKVVEDAETTIKQIFLSHRI